MADGRRGRSKRVRPAFAFDRRASGLLLHVTSLPGPHGSGDLSEEAHGFVDFCADAGQTLWQMLPVGPPVQRWMSLEVSSGFQLLVKARTPWLAR